MPAKGHELSLRSRALVTPSRRTHRVVGRALSCVGRAADSADTAGHDPLRRHGAAQHPVRARAFSLCLVACAPVASLRALCSRSDRSAHASDTGATLLLPRRV
eukprot:1027968-Pleurochrysis_carterae.AAC.1